MGNPFLAEATFVSPSLNRVRVVDLPGIEIPNHLRGLDGFALLSSAALKAMVNAEASELGLQAEMPNLLRAFDACFNTPSKSVRTAAQQIAEAYGRRLGILLLTLKRADEVNRRARPSWGDQHWEFWKHITTIHIGGGLLSGAMGPLAIAVAQDMLRSSGFHEMSMQLSPFAAYLPLAGLARSAPPGTSAMLLLDFGHTDIKRIMARYESGKNSELRPLPKIATRIGTDSAATSERELAEAGAAMVINAAAQSWLGAQNKDWPLSPVIGLSMACYLINGHPPPSEMGYYGRLQLLTDNLQTYLAARISEALGQKVGIILVHDGSAAGLTYAGSLQTVALMLGTAIGVGIPPDTNLGLQESAIRQENWKHALKSAID